MHPAAEIWEAFCKADEEKRIAMDRAAEDALIMGRGYLRVDPGGSIKHIPFDKVLGEVTESEMKRYREMAIKKPSEPPGEVDDTSKASASTQLQPPSPQKPSQADSGE